MENSTHSYKKTELAKFSSLYRSAIGIDVHSRVLVCCYQDYDRDSDTVTEQLAEFATTQSQLQEFAQWCRDLNPGVIVMESTGVFWMSPYEALEDIGFTTDSLALVNARDVKGRKGHKTDKNDAQHLAELGRLGAFRKSFVLSRYFRQTRHIARCYWSTRMEYAREKNRYQKQLNALGSRASSVFSDINGVAAKQILQAYVQGDPVHLKAVVYTKSSRLKASPKDILDALNICQEDDLRELLKLLDEGIQQLKKRCDQLLEMLKNRLKPYQDILNRLQTIPGIKETSALLLLAEIGDDLRSFSGIEKFCSWMGICPGNKISAGKSYSGAVAKGNRYIRQILTEVATGISLSRKGYLWQRFQTWKERRGRNRAIVALGHLVARIIFVIIKSGIIYKESTDDVLRQHRCKRLCKAIETAKNQGLELAGNAIIDRKTGELIST